MLFTDRIVLLQKPVEELTTDLESVTNAVEGKGL